MMACKVLVFSGSAREGSLNKRLARVATTVAEASGAVATFVDLRDFPMPLYDADQEAAEGVPASTRKFKAVLLAHDAFILVSPENNAGVSALLKNTLDWVSRPDGAEAGGVAYQGKIAGLCAASPGLLGGLRGLVALRASLQSLGVLVVPEQFALGRAHEAFDDQGALKDARHLASVETVVRRVIGLVKPA
jgi:chromate reductase, NAD(P)H dehydrogenase (quinone)